MALFSVDIKFLSQQHGVRLKLDHYLGCRIFNHRVRITPYSTIWCMLVAKVNCLTEEALYVGYYVTFACIYLIEER